MLCAEAEAKGRHAGFGMPGYTSEAFSAAAGICSATALRKAVALDPCTSPGQQDVGGILCKPALPVACALATLAAASVHVREVQCRAAMHAALTWWLCNMLRWPAERHCEDPAGAEPARAAAQSQGPAAGRGSRRAGVGQEHTT